ncbi:hypothetical protein GCM10010211_82510 [Streptomyces albospinus]|uniref:Uncharacterized protein n=1 Tax=Streptomyces albospinus TaxID=285515 RepID=A0ABQ2VNM0_9ACTN|nr:hypothetical protein GCM10010211_82510 [Streptomyces albospinus]
MLRELLTQSPFRVTGLLPRHGASLVRTPRFPGVLTVGRVGLMGPYAIRLPRVVRTATSPEGKIQ